MSPKNKALIEDIIYGRLDGDSCVETAENYMADVLTVDVELYNAMKRIDEAASDMINRLRELNDELNLEFVNEDI